MRIAVGGSAANPPHNGHLRILRAIMSHWPQFNRVIWIPSGTSDYKPEHLGSSPDDRVAMTELMIPKAMRLSVAPKLEVRYDEVYGKSRYAIDVLREVADTYKVASSNVYWFTGTDSVVNTWHRGEELAKTYGIIYIERPTGAESSSVIRDMIKGENPAWEQMVPYEVAEYIKRNGLYGYRTS